MLVFAGFTPSSPLLLPAINAANLEPVKATRAAVEELAEDLYTAHPDTLVMFSEHTTMYPDAFSLNVADPYLGDLSQFGDLGYQRSYHPDFAFVDRLQRHLRKSNLPVTLSTDARLHALTTAPLELLCGHLPNLRLVPVAPSELDAKSHFALGTAFKHLILETDRRVAVLAAGDMSHTLSKKAPAGYHKDGKVFDATLLDMLKEKNSSGLLQIPEKLLVNSHDTCYRQVCMLLGVLDGIHVTPSVLSYESPFGVGFGVVNFVL